MVWVQFLTTDYTMFGRRKSDFSISIFRFKWWPWIYFRLLKPCNSNIYCEFLVDLRAYYKIWRFRSMKTQHRLILDNSVAVMNEVWLHVEQKCTLQIRSMVLMQHIRFPLIYHCDQTNCSYFMKSYSTSQLSQHELIMPSWDEIAVKNTYIIN